MWLPVKAGMGNRGRGMKEMTETRGIRVRMRGCWKCWECGECGESGWGCGESVWECRKYGWECGEWNGIEIEKKRTKKSNIKFIKSNFLFS